MMELNYCIEGNTKSLQDRSEEPDTKNTQMNDAKDAEMSNAKEDTEKKVEGMKGVAKDAEAGVDDAEMKDANNDKGE